MDCADLYNQWRNSFDQLEISGTFYIGIVRAANVVVRVGRRRVVGKR